MGDATEVIALHFGAGVGGLMNATFGNAAELILGLFACFKGLDTLVKSSLCGSIIGNILLVLGASIFAGGLKYKKQHFSVDIANSESTMGVAAAVAFLIPTIYHSVTAPSGSTEDIDTLPSTSSEKGLSLGICALLIFTYFMMLYFQLRTHAEIFNEQGDRPATEEDKTMEGRGAGGKGEEMEGRALEEGRAAEKKKKDTDKAPLLESEQARSSPHSTRKAAILSLMNDGRQSASSPSYKKIYARLAVAEAKRVQQQQEQKTAVAHTRAFSDTSAPKPPQEHSQLFTFPKELTEAAARSDKDQPQPQSKGTNSPPRTVKVAPNPNEVVSPPDGPSVEKKEEGATAEEESEWSVRTAVIVLAVSCGLVAYLSEILTNVVEEAGLALGLSETFLGIVVIAVIGNAAEHSTAVSAALNNNLNISISIAFGSALQIALFVIPLIVFASYARGSDLGGMDLRVSELEVFGVSASVVIAWMVVHDGGTNWLAGLMLLMIYIILAISFYYMP